MSRLLKRKHASFALMLVALLAVTAIYWPGLDGTWLFDDYPNIVDNHGVQLQDASVPSLVRAALSSPASEFKRPLASLSFAANYLAVGLDPYWWKVTNLIIHLLNGLLVFWLVRALLRVDAWRRFATRCLPAGDFSLHGSDDAGSATHTGNRRGVLLAACVAAAWMLLPINLTGVLYVVQRMESMANVFVLLGLIGYTVGRQRMLAEAGVVFRSERSVTGDDIASGRGKSWLASQRNFILCAISITVPTAIGVLAKETAVMLPLYALLIEWALFRFARVERMAAAADDAKAPAGGRDLRIIGLFGLVLALPMVIGLVWLVPHVLDPETWATRNFTLGTRLLSEARIVADYLVWTLLPTPDALSFYHDDFVISTGLLAPWTTLTSIVGLAALIAFTVWVRARRPLVALGIALFLGCQLLTGTILPLELIYEHRNYFASFGLMLALIPLLAAPARATDEASGRADTARQPTAPALAEAASAGLEGVHAGAAGIARPAGFAAALEGMDAAATDSARPASNVATFKLAETSWISSGPASAKTGPETGPLEDDSLPFALPRYTLLVGLFLVWAGLTAFTAYMWGNPLRLAEDLALRAPQSPRAQYELGRTYIIYSHYDPASPFTPLVYAPLERSAQLPGSSILPEQALIFMNARMHRPLKDAWWDSMIAKLNSHPPAIQDESSLGALTQCAREGRCALPKDRMMQAFAGALSHRDPSARLLATYGDYAWNVLNDHSLGERVTREAVQAKPNEPAYQITLIRMLAAQGRKAEALDALRHLETLNFGGRLNASVAELRHAVSVQRSEPSKSR